MAMLKYCVIGERAFQRTWFSDADGAVKHAGQLLMKGPGKFQATVEELLVVKVVKKVRLAPPEPPLIVEDVD